MTIPIMLLSGCLAVIAGTSRAQDTSSADGTGEVPTVSLPPARSIGTAPYWEVHAGTIIASGGDANGDRADDLLVSRCDRNQPTPTDPVSLVSGRDGELLTSLKGGTGFGSFAYFAGDLDGDGHDDVLVARTSDGALKPDEQLGYAPERSRLEAYSSASIRMLYELVEPPLVEGPLKTVLGISAWTRPGEPVIDAVRLPDVDGDGTADLAWSIGRYKRTAETGRVTVGISSGKTGALIRRHEINVEKGLSGVGRLANLHDIDGDGVDDLGVLVRARTPSDLLVYSGATGVTILEIADAGTALAAAGDVDGDGRGDIVVADEFNDSRPGSGTVVVYSGATGAPRLRVSLEVPGDGAILTIAGLGDTNGDGRPDVAIGCPLLDRASREGRPAYVHIVSGNDGRLLQTLGGSLEDGSGPLDFPGRPHAFGIALAAVGDVDGDGLRDVAVSEDRYFNCNAGFGEHDRLMVFKGRR